MATEPNYVKLLPINLYTIFMTYLEVVSCGCDKLIDMLRVNITAAVVSHRSQVLPKVF